MSKTKVKIDWKQVENLLMAGCSGVEIAASLGIHENTLYKRCKNDLKVEFISGNYPVLENVIPFNTQNIIQFKKADLPKKITINEITKLFRLTSEGLQSKDSYTDSVTNFGIKINANCKFNIALNWNKFNTILKQSQI